MSHDRTTRSDTVPGADAINIAFWRQRLLDLPDLRWDKVTGLRDAIRSNRYEVEDHLDEVLARIELEVCALCDDEVAGVDLELDE